MSFREATDAGRETPSAAKKLVQGLMHLIMETSREMAVQCSNDEAEIEKHADRIQDLDNRLVSQALEVWLAHDGNIDLRTFFPAQSDSGIGNEALPQAAAAAAAAAKPPTTTTTTTIIGNQPLFPRTNQLVHETASLDTFYAWLSKTLPLLPPELVLMVAHTPLSTTSSSSSLFTHYLPHLHPYPGPCTAHVPNCRNCCCLPAAEEKALPCYRRPPPTVTYRVSGNCVVAHRSGGPPPPRKCVTGETTAVSHPDAWPPPPHGSAYAPRRDAGALRRMWGYADGMMVATGVRGSKDGFAPCARAKAEPDWFGESRSGVGGVLGVVFDEGIGLWRCGCELVLMGGGMGPVMGGVKQWRDKGEEGRLGRLAWNAWTRGWECGEVQPFDPGCHVGDYDSEDEREWEEREERVRVRRRRLGMRWVDGCERCQGDDEEDDSDDMGF